MRYAFGLALLGTVVPHLASAQVPAEATPSATPTPSAADQELMKQIEAATAPKPSTALPATAPASGAGGGGGLTMSNVFNPAMSVNGLFLGQYSSTEYPADPEATRTGIGIQEVEMQFVSNVDPYFSANLVLTMDKGVGLGVEEGFISPTWQPWGFSFRTGQLKVPFGRENYLHTHALPFVDKSLVGDAVFGKEGLNEFGVEASWLAPLPFYSLVYFDGLNGDNQIEFAGPRGSDFTGFTGIKNLFDLNDDTTLELGGSYAAGRNMDDRLSQVFGADAIVKWKPGRHATTRSAIFTIEGLYANHPNAPAVPPAPAVAESTNRGGFYSFFQWQLAQRWFTAARFDYLGQPVEAGTGITRRGSVILAFAPTEFSALRLQGSETFPAFGATPVYEGFLQLNFTLGAHPAHAY